MHLNELRGAATMGTGGSAVVGEQLAGLRGRRRWILWVGVGLLTAAAAMAVLVSVAARRVEPFLRARIVAALGQRFDAKVELDSFHVSLESGLHGQWGVFAVGRGLRMWPTKDRPRHEDEVMADRPKDEELSSGMPIADEPLIRVDEFHFHAPLRYESGKPLRISLVQIEGLAVVVPPRTHNPGSAGTRRFNLPVTVALLHLDQTPWKIDFLDLIGERTAKG